jgi:protein phosphatase
VVLPEEDDAADALAIERKASKTKRRWIATTLTLVALALLGGALYWGYTWSQNQYFVGAEGEKVTIYQGIPQVVFGLELSHPYESTTYRLKQDLTEPYQQQVSSNATRNISVQEARDWIDDAVRQSARDRRTKTPSTGANRSLPPSNGTQQSPLPGNTSQTSSLPPASKLPTPPGTSNPTHSSEG